MFSVFLLVMPPFFNDGPGGTGKSFLYNTMIEQIGGAMKKNVVFLASSGIAALILHGGRTVQWLDLQHHPESTNRIHQTCGRPHHLGRGAHNASTCLGVGGSDRSTYYGSACRESGLGWGRMIFRDWG